MANQNAKIDENGIKTVLGTLQSDGVSTVRLKVNPTNGGLKVVDATTGTASTRRIASRDDNGRPVWMGVSSSDGITLIPIAMDSNGNLLVTST